MTDSLKQLIKKKKLSLTPTKDYLGNIIDIGDTVILAQCSVFTCGVVVSLPPTTIKISCYRNPSARKWDRKTASYIIGQGGVSMNYDLFKTNSWIEHRMFDNIPLIINSHNSLHSIPINRNIYSDGFRKANSFINLTKLNLIPHENLKD
jgi:hypothetical protein